MRHLGVCDTSRGVSVNLRTLQWFRPLREEILAELAPHALSADHDEETVLWNAGDSSRSFTFIVRGLVQISRTNGRGDEAILGIFGPGESVGTLASLEGRGYPASAIATTRITIVQIPSVAMREALARWPEMLTSATRALGNSTNELFCKLEIVSAGPVAIRLACLFLHLAERFGDETDGGPNPTHIIPIALSRGSLAKLVGAREETVIRVLSTWRTDGWVSTTADGFELHAPERLQAMVASG